jgi:hypothetical protein
MRGATASISLILALTGCWRASEPESSDPPAGAKPVERANPLLAAERPGPTERAFGGQVTERLEAGGYSYLAVDRGSGSWTWVATMGRGAEVGTRVRVEGFAAQDSFHSRRLDRRFERIVFGVVERDAG